MVDLLKMGTAAAAAVAVATSPAGALAGEFKESPGYLPPVPTNPTPRRADVASRDWDLINLSRPSGLIADAKPLVVAQVAPSDGQLANSVVRPYGIDAAGQISDLELQRRQNNQQLNDGLEGHNQFQNDALNRILKRTGK
jgi:hypothetical protein